MSLDTAIEVKHIKKKYNDLLAVDGVDLEVYKGECFGLLGPMGAGKSTLMQMMYCHTLVTEGELYVLGLNVKRNYKEIKSKIGIVPQDHLLDADFNVIDNLKLFANYHFIEKSEAEEKIRYLLKFLRLEEFANDSIMSLNESAKRRLVIARALINSPEILFLDEPTLGLDPQSRVWLWDFIKQMKDLNGTIFLTTHYVEEAEALCDRIAIMDKGKILCLGQPKELIDKHIGNEIVEFYSNPVDVSYYLNRLKEFKFDYLVYKNMVLVFIPKDQDSMQIFELIKSDKVILRKPTLNDVFLKFAGYNLRDE